MSFFRHKHKKIKYENLPVRDKKQDNRTVISQGFSLDAVNLYINNFVNPRDTDSTRRKLNFQDEGTSKSWDVLTTKLHQEKEETQEDYSMETKARNNAAIFKRLKRKLETIKNFYPNIYYSDQSVIDLWAKQNELYKMDLDVLEYDNDSPLWLWI